MLGRSAKISALVVILFACLASCSPPTLEDEYKTVLKRFALTVLDGSYRLSATVKTTGLDLTRRSLLTVAQQTGDGRKRTVLEVNSAGRRLQVYYLNGTLYELDRRTGDCTSELGLPELSHEAVVREFIAGIDDGHVDVRNPIELRKIRYARFTLGGVSALVTLDRQAPSPVQSLVYGDPTVEAYALGRFRLETPVTLGERLFQLPDECRELGPMERLVRGLNQVGDRLTEQLAHARRMARRLSLTRCARQRPF